MNDLDEIKVLAGISNRPRLREYSSHLEEINKGINISVTGTEKGRLQKEHNIKPGTPEWFKLWFSLPYFTGEKPI